MSVTSLDMLPHVRLIVEVMDGEAVLDAVDEASGRVSDFVAESVIDMLLVRDKVSVRDAVGSSECECDKDFLVKDLVIEAEGVSVRLRAAVGDSPVGDTDSVRDADGDVVLEMESEGVLEAVAVRDKVIVLDGDSDRVIDARPVADALLVIVGDDDLDVEGSVDIDRVSVAVADCDM